LLFVSVGSGLGWLVLVLGLVLVLVLVLVLRNRTRRTRRRLAVPRMRQWPVQMRQQQTQKRAPRSPSCCSQRRTPRRTPGSVGSPCPS
jgi:hypothetical protein